jgi:hypothetical protein
MPQLEIALVSAAAAGTNQAPRGAMGGPYAHRWISTLVLFMLALSACEDPRFGRAVVADNHTNTVLTFAAIVDGESTPIAESAEPGESITLISGLAFSEHSVITEGDCTKVDLVALDPAGREVARHPPPLCIDEVWVIEGD